MTKRPTVAHKIRNAFRKSANQGYRELIELRSRSPQSGYRGLVAASQALRLPNTLPVLPRKAHSFKVLFRRPILPPLELPAELAWANELILINKELVRDFCNLKSRFSIAVLNGERAEALAHLNALEETTGKSDWLCDAIIAFYQEFDGVKAQKAITAKITSGLGSTLVNPLFHYRSLRNEPLVDHTRFRFDLEQAIANSDVLDPHRHYLNFALLADFPESDRGIAELLAVAATLSPVDLYEVTINSLLSTRCSASRAQYAATARSLANTFSNLPDPRLEVLSRIYEFAAVASDNDDGASPALERITRTARQAKAPMNETNLEARTTELLRLVFSRTEFCEYKADELRKYSLNFRFIEDFALLRILLASILSRDVSRGLKLSRIADHRALSAIPNAYTNLVESSVPDFLLSILASTHGDFCRNDLTTACSQLYDRGDTHDRVQATKITTAYYQLHNEWWQSICASIKCILDQPGCVSEFSFYDVLSRKNWSDLKAYANTIELSIALHLACLDGRANSETDTANQYLRLATVKLIKSRDVSRHSELRTNVREDEVTALIYFLRHVCSLYNMEGNPNFGSTHELVTERIRICQVLTELDPVRSAPYTQEIRDLTYDLELDRGVRQFDQSRIYVNTENLKRWAIVNFKNDYERYIALLDYGSDLEEIRDAILKLNAAPPDSLKAADLPSALFKEPSSEAEKLLLEILQRLAVRYLTDPNDGLDSYLSLRVRHGSFASTIRGTLEEARLITNFDDERKSYSQNEHWLNRLSLHEPENKRIANEAFTHFSEQVDRKLGELVNQQIQVRSTAKPLGLFALPLQHVDINLIKFDISKATSIDAFLEHCLSYFSIVLERCLTVVRDSLSEQLSNEVENALTNLEKSISSVSPEREFANFNDAVAKARTNYANTVGRVTDWFTATTSEELSAHYSISQLVDIGLRVATNTHPTFSPRITREIADDIPVLVPSRGGFIVADIMFIAFDNVFNHSNHTVHAEIYISVNLVDEGMIQIYVSNPIDPNKRTDANIDRLQSIRRLIEEDKYHSRISDEGGTGFLKLHKLVNDAPIDGIRGDVKFGYSDIEDEFILEVNLPVKQTVES